MADNDIAAAAESAPPVDPAAEAAALREENAALKDRLLRAIAETENLRRRSEREAADARVYAVTKFAGDMLSTADNLARALASVSAEVREAADPAVRTLIEGVELTERDLIAALSRHSVKPISAEGEKFDPNVHQAVFEVEDATKPVGTVANVMQGGWRIGERTLRPAMVGVTKGGPARS
ncbi:MAG: nucleotide exchange factor GrpE [Hyphomicrobiales bacterium]|nr:nucleotide exchange factor GrpE [Hyphomicrobiales bacterium]